MKIYFVSSGALRTILLIAIVSGLITVTTVAAQTATSTEPAVEETATTTTPDTVIASTAEATEIAATSTEPSTTTTTEATSTEPAATFTEPMLLVTTAMLEQLSAATTTEIAWDSLKSWPVQAGTIMPTQINTDGVTPTEPEPQGLTKVRIIGTKFVDYFTDGTNEFSFPGNPDIDAQLGLADAPTPTHEGLTWVHTTSHYLYDTASGNLEEGQYALQPNGSYISESHPFVSSTSTQEASQNETLSQSSETPSAQTTSATDTTEQVSGASTSTEPAPEAATSATTETSATSETTPTDTSTADTATTTE